MSNPAGNSSLQKDNNRLGTPISDDSSEDSLSQIRGLEEDQGIYHHEEVVVSPRNESDDDLPLRRFQNQLPDTVSVDHIVEDEESDIIAPDSVPPQNMERRRSVRFSGPQANEEDGRNRHFRTPSPESLRYIQALENPMAASAGEFEDEFKDLTDSPVNRPSQPPPLGSPPAYTSGDEGGTTPPPTMSQPPAKSITPTPTNTRQGSSMNEILMRKISQPIQNMIRRASRFEEDNSQEEDDEDEEEDDDDYTEDEIAVLTYIDAFKATEQELRPTLRPFSIEYIPAMGEVDLFVKVPRPDDIDDNIGLTQIDEPPCNQSDATIVDMQIRQAVKDISLLDDVVPVKVLDKPDEKPDEIKNWIASVKELHKSKPPATVNYHSRMPDTETLMQETPPQLQEKLRAPPAELDVSLEQYVDICCNLLNIPVTEGHRIDSVHMIFSLLQQFQTSQHFRNLQNQTTDPNGEGPSASSNMDRLEL